MLDEKTGELMPHDGEGTDPLLSVEGTSFGEDYVTVYDLILEECADWTPEAVEKETGVPLRKCSTWHEAMLDPTRA